MPEKNLSLQCSRFWRAVISRSIAVACLALAVTGILTVKKGGIPFSRYLHFMTVPLVFLFFSTLAIVLNFPGRPLIFLPGKSALSG